MNISPDITPLEYAQSQKPADLRKVIKSIKNSAYDEFADRCRVCFEHFLAGNIEQAEWWSQHAEGAR